MILKSYLVESIFQDGKKLSVIWFIPLGLLVGTIGTLIGAGGGFILMPILLFLYPQETPEILTGISMAVIFLNTASGSVADFRMKRIDFKLGAVFSLAAVPGAYFGAFATRYFDRAQFDAFLGFFLVLISGLLVWKTLRGYSGDSQSHSSSKTVLIYGSLISAVVGFLSSILGIGGGIIHVPALIYLLGFPAHMATATSHFVLACTSLVATVEHGIAGNYAASWVRVLLLGLGVIVGAQIGAHLSIYVKSRTIVVGLAVAMALAGMRLLF